MIVISGITSRPFELESLCGWVETVEREIRNVYNKTHSLVMKLMMGYVGNLNYWHKHARTRAQGNILTWRSWRAEFCCTRTWKGRQPHLIRLTRLLLWHLMRSIWPVPKPSLSSGMIFWRPWSCCERAQLTAITSSSSCTSYSFCKAMLVAWFLKLLRILRA